jgi:hypothetical protein
VEDELTRADGKRCAAGFDRLWRTWPALAEENLTILALHRPIYHQITGTGRAQAGTTTSSPPALELTVNWG